MQAVLLRSILDREYASAVDWMRGSDRNALVRLRCLLAEDDSAAALASLTPAEADIVARLAIIGFDEAGLQGGLDVDTPSMELDR